MKRNVSIALVLLVLFTSSSPAWSSEPRENLVKSSNEEIRLRGEAIEYECFFDSCWWTIEVEQVISGPPVTGQVKVTTVFGAPCPPGHVDPNIEVGDKVEVYGEYWPAYNEVWVCSDDYYMIEVSKVKFRATALHNEEEGYSEYGNYFLDVRVDEILEDPQGNLGEYATVHYQDQHNFSQGDCLEVYGTFLEGIDVAVGGPYGSPEDYIQECGGCPPDLSVFAPQVDGCTVTINGVVTSPCNDPVQRINWDWGDGTSNDSWFAATHTYAQSGTYSVSVTAYTAAGHTATASKMVTVSCDVPPTLTPVIIVPGYGASLCFSGHCGWMPIGAEPVYRDLIQALEGAGYRSGENLIIGYYPWWRPHTESAQDYVANKWVAQALQTSPNGKIHIITHSDGALVARQYIQAAGPSHVDKLIMIAPPNQGVPHVYYFWGGGAFPPGYFEGWLRMVRAAIKVITSVFCPQVLPGNSDFWVCLRTHVPSFQELMPVADHNYLYNVDTGQTKKPSDLTEENTNPNLEQLNAAIILDLFNDVGGVSIYGSNDHDTLFQLDVKNRGILDWTRWADGKPIPGEQKKGRRLGDGTIPEVHQGLPDCTSKPTKCQQDFDTLSASHNETVSQVRDCVLYELGLASECKPATVAVESLSDEDDVVFFSMVTEARWLISDSQGRRVGYLSNGQFVSEIPGAEVFEEAEYHVIGIPEPVTGNYNVQVTGLSGTQSYNISAFTYLSGDTLLQTEGTVGSGSTDTVPAPYSPPSTLTGNVALQGRPSPSGASWVTDVDVGFYLPPDDSLLYSYSATTDEYGRFTIPDVPRGIYNIWVKGSHTLSSVKSNVSIGDGTNEVYFGTLLEGDANNDNCVNAPDFSILRTAFGKCQGQGGYDARVDFNEDGCVNAPDFSLLRTNFGLCGDITVGATMSAGEEQSIKEAMTR